MPDATRSSHPPTWSEAFAALPLEAPADSRWPCIDARLETEATLENAEPEEAPTSPWRARWALAASLFASAALPFAWYAFDRGPEPRNAQAASTTSADTAAVAANTGVNTGTHAATNSGANLNPGLTTDASPGAASGALAARDHDARRMTASTARVFPRASGARATRAAPPGVTVDNTRAAPRMGREASPRVAIATEAVPSVSARSVSARSVSARSVSARSVSARPVPAPSPQRPDLERLYALSARLESLLALSRDPRVESGPAAALSSDFDAALALIDDRLALPDLPADERVSLWQARVDTLQQAAGFEGQLRLLAAQGERFDGTLVGID